jgi:5-methylcytosine-specific restriction enzyme A
MKLADILTEKEYRDEYGRPSAAKRGYGHSWRKKREEVIQRDKGKCSKCRKAVRGRGNKQVDHITPKSRKGEDSKSNLRLLCGDCHRKKTAKYDKRDKRRGYK